MDINIKSIHFEISDKLEAFINKKIDKIVRRFPTITKVDVSLKVVKPETALNKQALVMMALPEREELVADKTADTFEEAIDLALDALEKQLEKKKNKK